MSTAPAAGHARDGFVVPHGVLWVFGYGLLMWDAGFPYTQAAPALLHGYHRAFCVYSHRFRGTNDNPGLVLGLNPGGSCRGMAFRVAAGDVACALDALWEREMTRRTYFPRLLPVRFAGRSIRIVRDRALERLHARVGELRAGKQRR